jgi:hypothetical protein
MFHWRHPREIPLEIRLEVETLISDLGGQPSLVFQHAQEANGEMRARDLFHAAIGRLRRRLLVLSTRQRCSE